MRMCFDIFVNAYSDFIYIYLYFDSSYLSFLLDLRFSHFFFFEFFRLLRDFLVSDLNRIYRFLEIILSWSFSGSFYYLNSYAFFSNLFNFLLLFIDFLLYLLELILLLSKSLFGHYFSSETIFLIYFFCIRFNFAEFSAALSLTDDLSPLCSITTAY